MCGKSGQRFTDRSPGEATHHPSVGGYPSKFQFFTGTVPLSKGVEVRMKLEILLFNLMVCSMI